MLVRGIVRTLLALVLAGWWLTPTTLAAVTTAPVPEPVCASWSFGDASPTTDGVDLPVTVVVAACPDAED
ncbi:MAG: hypothetical protein KY469_01770 [Actinobacteria bacterium]|nr:hypothetical protein [Actinomycetota bacterium]